MQCNFVTPPIKSIPFPLHLSWSCDLLSPIEGSEGDCVPLLSLGLKKVMCFHCPSWNSASASRASPDQPAGRWETKWSELKHALQGWPRTASLQLTRKLITNPWASWAKTSRAQPWSAKPPSQPVDLWEIRNGCCFKPLNLCLVTQFYCASR